MFFRTLLHIFSRLRAAAHSNLFAQAGEVLAGEKRL
jgi:hypothetical protein